MITAVAMISLGLLLRHTVGASRFNRTNGAGVQQYSSYTKSVFIRLIELLLRLFGSLLIFFGMLVFLSQVTD